VWATGTPRSEQFACPATIDKVAEEIVEVLDEAGAVVGLAPRSQVRTNNLWHRTSYIIVWSSSGAVLVHRRALTKQLWPDAWDLAFGGGCEVAEGWADAAARELHEEAGIRTPLRELGTYRWDGDGSREIGRLYETVSDGPFQHPPDEVAEARFVGRAELDAFLERHDVLAAARAVVLPYLR
jgi:isopentenyldiphosphate isomerase